MLHDYPDTAKFLKDDERKVLRARLLLDNDGCSHEFKRRFIKDAFFDWKIWVAAVMFHAALMPVYTFSLFSPTLTANLGYTAATAQLVSSYSPDQQTSGMITDRVSSYQYLHTS